MKVVVMPDAIEGTPLVEGRIYEAFLEASPYDPSPLVVIEVPYYGRYFFEEHDVEVIKP